MNEPPRTIGFGRVQAWVVALGLLCAGTCWVQSGHIARTVPYPRHVDESAVASPALRVLETGSLQYATFNYPSLPAYLAAGGMAAGFFRAALRQEIGAVQQIGRVSHPYYGTEPVMRAARQLFALLSIVALVATGVAAWLAFRRSPPILLAPLVLLGSPLFFYHAWEYLNVDIVGACCVMLTLAACLHGTGRPSLLHSAIVPGACAGLATACKYSLAVAVLPVLLAISFSQAGTGKIRAWVVALGATTAAFLIAVPYSVLDLPAFLNGVAYDLYHYRVGHAGFTGPPGWPQLLFYARHLVTDFGWAVVVLALVGWVACVAADWRRAAVLSAFPAALVWLLASHPVHFTRNALALHPFVALFAAFGFVALHAWALGLAVRRRWVSRGRERIAAATAGVLLAAGVMPLGHLAGHLRDRTDSRNQARAWIEARLPREWVIVIPVELGFDARPLEADGRRVVAIDFTPGAPAVEAALREVPRPAVVLAPRWGADTRFEGRERADALNDLSRRWRSLRSFGTGDVLINYDDPVPFGDPAFAIASLQ